jgi:glyoxylase-like metal-dependent hydrolase (beta-lactamase superfamily II)
VPSQIPAEGVPVLRRVAEGVFVHQSEFVQSNAVVVQGQTGVLLIDPGVHESEMDCLADDLSGQTVVAGFSTHPHWDHLLWHAKFGDAPRFGTARCAASARDALSGAFDPSQHGIPDEVCVDLIGVITGLPTESTEIPWDGPRVRILEHQAHAPGHAALLIEARRVLVAGDMLSDILIPLLDFDDTGDPVGDYESALSMLETMMNDVDVLVPGHGSIGGRDELRARIDQDRAYVEALGDGHGTSDPRFAAQYSKEWLPSVHEQQLRSLAQRKQLDGLPD